MLEGRNLSAVLFKHPGTQAFAIEVVTLDLSGRRLKKVENDKIKNYYRVFLEKGRTAPAHFQPIALVAPSGTCDRHAENLISQKAKFYYLLSRMDKLILSLDIAPIYTGCIEP